MTDKKIKKMTTLAMFCAFAYVVMCIIKIPVVLFLKYEPKDIIIVICGFLMGPMSALTVSVAVSLIEMFTVSDTGIIGFIMNILSTCSYACVASLIYKYKKDIKGAIIGLCLGSIICVLVMVLWNSLITPLYMNVPRSEVLKLIIPAILPFNILKTFLNSAITLLIYKPVVGAIRKTKLIEFENKPEKIFSAGLTISAIFVLITCILAVLLLKGVI